jgi:hypothetical protein
MPHENWENGASSFVQNLPISESDFLMALAEAGVDKAAKTTKKDAFKIVRSLLAIPAVAGASAINPGLGLFVALRAVYKNISDMTEEEKAEARRLDIHFF